MAICRITLEVVGGKQQWRVSFSAGGILPPPLPSGCLVESCTIHRRMFNIIFSQTQDACSTRLPFVHVSRCARCPCQVTLFESLVLGDGQRSVLYWRNYAFLKHLVCVWTAGDWMNRHEHARLPSTIEPLPQALKFYFKMTAVHNCFSCASM